LFVACALVGPTRADELPRSLAQAREIAPQALREAYAAALRARGAVAEVRPINEFQIEVRTTAGRSFTLSVFNLREELQALRSPAERQAAFRAFVERVHQVATAPPRDPARPPTREEFERSLLVVARNRSFLDDFAAASGGRGGQPLFRPVAGDVILVAAVDSPAAIRTVTAGEGRAFGLSDEEVIVRGRANLLRLAERVQVVGYGTARALEFDPNFNASLLLLDEVWNALPDRPARMVVAAPTREIIVYGSEDDPQAMAFLRDVAAMRAESRPVTSRLLRRSGDRWVPLD
jgi:hypothetical protein